MNQETTAPALPLPNTGKTLCKIVDNQTYQRYPIKTHLVTEADDIRLLTKQYVSAFLKKDDILFISERIVAITQGRAFHINTIKPSWLAQTLCRYVTKSPHGIGIGSPYTMELAIREAGWMRIVFAAAGAAISKPLGIRGIFYHLVGNNINAIDGPCSYTLPPYNEHAKLGPAQPDRVAKSVKSECGCEVVIIDANDLGVRVLGRSSKKISKKFCCAVFQDNPLGQSSQQTPMCIVRVT